MCITGANLEQERFSATTGDVNAPDIGYTFYDDYLDIASDYPYADSVPESLTVFSPNIVGKVSGAKPPRINGKQVCMPIKDTPKIPAHKFDAEYYINISGQTFKPISDEEKRIDLRQSGYYDNNRYLQSTFFMDIPTSYPGFSDLDCPHLIGWHNKPVYDVYDLVNLNRLKADNCYNYYILQHAKNHFYTTEIPGGGTDNPQTLFDPDRNYLDSCQPLVNGIAAETLQRWGWKGMERTSQLEKWVAMYPVLRYANRPDMDEAEYLLSTYLSRSWDANFEQTAFAKAHPDYMLNSSLSNPFNYTKVDMPCVTPVDQNGIITVTPDPPPPPPPPPPPNGRCFPGQPEGYPDSTPDSYPDCGPVHYYVPNVRYTSPGINSGYFCQNVEKITEPSHPFSPRQYTTGMIDRDYSSYVTQRVKYPDMCGNECRYGYSDWGIEGRPASCDGDDDYDTGNYPEPDDCNPWGLRGHTKEWRDANPAVQCAIVPVDIMEFRSGSFHSCIMQRINYNMNAWIADGYPNPATWVPPCKTRYWEYDDMSTCPVEMTIQQCCRIVVKDLVPANMLKMRTCEGLLQERIDDRYLQGILHENFGLEGGGFIDRDDPYSPRPITHITDDSFGIFGYNNYLDALNVSMLLNRSQCVGTEPDEYRFNHHFLGFSTVPRPDDVDKCENYDDYGYGEKTPNINTFVGMHMPYMRWWDTGVSAGQSRHGGSFVNTLGGFDTIIGVGREERNRHDAKFMYQKLTSGGDYGYGPWVDGKEWSAGPGTTERLSQEQPSQMGRIGGWSELKAHQMWSIRRSNLYCIGRYEKLFKPMSMEDLVLAKAGAGFTNTLGEERPWKMGWRGYVNSTAPWPYSYVPTQAPDDPFVPTAVGLDNAVKGDIIFYPKSPGLWHAGYVVDVGDWEGCRGCEATFDNERKIMVDARGNRLIPTKVHVVAWDQGRFPTSTGMTDKLGIGGVRQMFKYEVPETYRNWVCDQAPDNNPNDPWSANFRYRRLATSVSGATELCPDTVSASICKTNNCQPSCDDSNYTSCVLPNGTLDWNRALVYRISHSDPSYLARHCDGTPSKKDLAETYSKELGKTVEGANRDPKVIYQSESIEIGSDVWGYCSNAGFDAPLIWAGNYDGAQTGAITDQTLCGPAWRGCSSGGTKASGPGSTRFAPTLDTRGNDDWGNDILQRNR